MPRKTFFNLAQEKRNKLMAAIRNEFARVPFDEVSINKIVQAADIPRGSFYQYFDDKYDMLRYLLSDYQRMVFDHALESLKKSEGDLFEMFTDIIDFSVAFVMQEETNAFCKNLFADIRINTSFYSAHAGINPFKHFLDELLPHIDQEKLDLRGPDDLLNMIKTILPMTGHAMAEIFFDITRFNDIRACYTARLELLKRGFNRIKEA